MGAGSPQGSDSDISSLGIVYGHAYSVLDVAVIDGHKLVQLRNPWGNQTEWKGAWGDHSKEWNERRKRIAYERMEANAYEKAVIGEADGIFWMSLNDFFMNFDSFTVCRFFDQEWKEIFYESEWKIEKGNAGGCTNYEHCGSNPQMQLSVKSNSKEPVDVFIQLNARRKPGQEQSGIGFELYDLGGARVSGRNTGNPVETNYGGYRIAESVIFDGSLESTDSPLTLFVSTFKPNTEAQFRVTLHYRHSQGTVTLKPF